MICAYCNEDRKGTKEHIIPDGILDLFPECDISIREDVSFKGDFTIKDVCSECNNDKLGALDSYGKQLIAKYFVQEYKRSEKLLFDYDFQILSRWLLKICYNYSRSHKLDIGWFSRNIKYILNGDNTGASYSVFAGLSVNTSPAPEYLFGNIKMNICHSPILSDTGFLIPMDAYHQQFRINDNLRPLRFKEAEGTFNIRFGSALFMIFLWKEDVEQKQIDIIRGLFVHQFRHKELNSSNTVTIERCTEAMTCHISNIVVGDLAIDIGDSANGMMRTDKFAENIQNVFGDGWSNHVKEVKANHIEQKIRMKERKQKKKK